MHAEHTDIDGLLIIHPRVFEDERGFFFESYNEAAFRRVGIDSIWRQDNHSRSVQDSVRGLHFQRGAGQAKIVRCVAGRIWDVAVDIRPGSPTFGRWSSVELSADNRLSVFVPAGFAHGFAVLSDYADTLYKCDRLYDAAIEDGIAWDDPDLAIPWPVKTAILSERDRSNQSFSTFKRKIRDIS
jgi:dTDP-4-dehydrorhamnose 3,5-epimerase